MPYCTHCGTFVADQDRYCPKCGALQATAGAAQAPPQPPPPAAVPSAGIRPNVAAMLCYIPLVGWIAAIIFLVLDPYRYNRHIRFHAFQGLYLAVIAFIVHNLWFAVPFRHIGLPFFWLGLRGIVQLLVLIAQIVGIVKTVKGCDYRVPLIADLADKSLT